MDYYPAKKSERLPWLRNLKNELAKEAANLGLPADEIAAEQVKIQEMLDRNEEVEIAAAAYRKSLAALNTAHKAVGESLRKFIRRVKTQPLYNEETGKNLGIVNRPTASNLVDYKPGIDAQVTGGFVQIFFVKKKVKSVNIYCKLPGETAFTLLATAVESPFVDTRPPAVAGVAELRQYCAMGVVKNTEVGQRSEIVSVSYGV